jgi:Uma2 family endonuclease
MNRLQYVAEAEAMSTVEHPRTATLPPLVIGEHLDQPTFHERYEAMPSNTRAELIGGIVYMPPMLGSEHSDDHVSVVGLLFLYQRAAPGVRANIESSTVLNDRNEVQPDCSLRILADYGGQTTTIPKWIEGAPELVVEISRSSRSIDLGPKLQEYQEAGVKEYVVFALDPDEVIWHERRGDKLVAIPPRDDGLYHSKAFPGLWLDPKAMIRRDLDALIVALDCGLASPEHAAFVEELARRRAKEA